MLLVRRNRRDVYIEDLNFGFTTFDSMPRTLLTLFQCITMEGWTEIMNI